MSTELATIPVPGVDAALVATLIDDKPMAALRPKVQHALYGEVNSYPAWVWESAFADRDGVQ